MKKVFSILSVIILMQMSGGQSFAQVTKSVLDQNADQAQGNYAATNLNYLGSGSLGMMQSAWKDPLQHMGEGQTRPGYTKYYWTPELVLPVRVREGMYTLINFPSWEVVENVYLGDSLSFSAEIQGPSSLMVYPEASQFVGVDTNMIVFGRSGNKYVFYVQSETINTDRITNAIIDIEVVKKKQGANGVITGGGAGGGHINASSYSANGSSEDATFTRNLQKEDWIERIPVDPTKFRFDIEVYVPNPDDIIIAPERVWRDNIFTYIDLGEKALTAVQRPIITLIVERSETPVGFRSAGPNNRLIIVEGMGDMVMRSGKRIVCLKLRRADSDGLENTIYAKTNDWDLQSQYASNPTSEGMQGIENVYNDGLSDGMVASQNENTINQKPSFFNNSTFFSAPSNANGKEPQTSLDALPKATPITGIPQSKNTASAVEQPVVDVEKEKLTGQIDVRAGQAEIITPEYNNQNVNVGVDYQANVPQQAAPQVQMQMPDNIAQTVSLGSSNNNSSPVLIAPKSSNSTANKLISAETEALLKEFRSGKAFESSNESNISIELGTDENVNNLEKLWNDISKRYSAALGSYHPFYSVDTAADGQGKEVFHLRVGPIKSLEDGDNICSQLGRNGIFCSVVRIQ
ncbi:MAG: TrbG/VirB9 family P-type conjugative transfer protein [Acetobacter sp.]|nr:TrbG/VirB9 family P-type conjugative transfer protein [Acetobacter sp.]